MKWRKSFLLFMLFVSMIASMVACAPIQSETPDDPSNRTYKEDMNVRVIPVAKDVQSKGRGILYQATITPSDSFQGAIDSFVSYSQILGISFVQEQDGEISVTKDDSAAKGDYRLVINQSGVAIFAADMSGVNHAFASLLQMIEVGPGKDAFYAPECTITDGADTDYRGMMVDVSSGWLYDVSYIKSYIDMCYFYKMSVLHLHLSDNESYCIPSDAYPNLNTKETSYTKEQIAEIVAYAEARGVELMPEIEAPGHSLVFQNAYPELFGKGIIHLHEDSVEAVRTLIREICTLFPYSDYIHVGGEEADIKQWTTCKDCRAYARDHGFNVAMKDKDLLAEQYLGYFINEMANVVKDCGRQPVAWEAFRKGANDYVSKDVIVMSWENYYQTTPDLIAAGFKVINCTWTPLYVVAPYQHWTTQEIFNWDIYKWQPVHPNSPYLNTGLEIEPTDVVLGGQMSAWSGNSMTEYYPSIADGMKAQRDLLIERIPYLAQNTWNVEKNTTYNDLSKQVQVLNAKLYQLIGKAA